MRWVIKWVGDSRRALEAQEGLREAEQSRDGFISIRCFIGFSPTLTLLPRMSLANILQRRIKARKDESDDDEASSILQESNSEKSDFNDDLSSVESSEGGESQQQQNPVNQAGTGYETVRNNFSYHKSRLSDRIL